MQIKLWARYSLFFLSCYITSSSAQEALPPKNIIFIMLDDAGYFDFGYNNNILQQPDAVTPNIDQLRAAGKAFTQFYASSAICTPTRASLLTGSMPITHGALDAWPQLAKLVQSESGNSGISNTHPQLGQLMQQLGKKTAHHGKWHVGLSRKQYRHTELGFDDFSYHQTIPATNFTNWSGDYKFVSNAKTETLNVDYIDYYYTQKVLDFIDQNADQEFYVNFWPLTPHFPFTPPRNFSYSDHGLDPSHDPANGGGDRGSALGMMAAIDQQIGLITEKLREKNLLDDTLIVITSDNGATKRQQNREHWHRGTKGTLYEGGVRMPTIAHWPNGIAAGTTNDSVIATFDLLPTFMELLGQDPSFLYKQIDGRSKAAAFTGDGLIEHEPILWQINGNSVRAADNRANKVYALRNGNYKLVKAERRNDLTDPNAYFLFDVVNDRQEKINLRNSQPEIFTQMRSDMLQMRLKESLFGAVPESTDNTLKVIPFDPRLDVTSKDMTLIVDLTVPQQLERARRIYYKPGSQIATIGKNRRVRWRVTGSTPEGEPTSTALISPPLEPGTHQIAFVIGGFKNDFTQLELYINGEKVDELDDGFNENAVRTVWSTISSARIGDNGLTLENIRYHTVRLWPDEWNSL